MKNNQQGTVSNTLYFSGPGLHTAKHHKISVFAAAENSGIVFQKVSKRWGGGSNATNIPAHFNATKESPLCTCLVAENGEQVRTVEHLMAAFYACGIDNALVRVEGSEIPVLDGSAKVFIDEIEKVGVTKQAQSRMVYRVTKTTEFKEGDKRFIRISPPELDNEGLFLDIAISLGYFGRLSWQGEISPELFKQEMSAARTFGRFKNGLLAKLTYFNKDPICLGANMKTALVLNNKKKVLNKGGLRMANEIIYHRVLDLMGDLMLSGGHIEGRITARSTAHRLNHGLLKSLFEQDHIEIS